MLKRFKDFGLTVLLTLLLLAFCEGTLRFLFPDRIAPFEQSTTSEQNTISGEDEVLAYESHPEALVVLRPNIEKTFRRTLRNGGDVIRWKTGPEAFRGGALRENPAKRIMVYGDSNIQARFSRREKSFVGRLEEHLEARGQADVEVVNAGVIGSGPDQDLLRAREEIPLYTPDLVIAHVFVGNDFGDLIRNRLFELDPLGEVVRTGFLPRTDSHLKASSDPSRQPSEKGWIDRLLLMEAITEWKRTLTRESPEAVIERLQRIAEQEAAVYRGGEPSQTSVFRDNYSIDLAIDPDSEASRVKIALMGGILAQMRELAEQHGARFLVLIQPAAIDLTPDNSLIGYPDLERFPGYARSHLTDAAERACREQGLKSLNLLETFLAADPPSLYFHWEDDHWNDRGQEVAAAATAEYLIEHLNEYLSTRPAKTEPMR